MCRVPTPTTSHSHGSSPTSAISTPTIVARLQEELGALIARSRMSAPGLTSGLVECQSLVTEMVSRWRRSTTLALDSIKTFEDQMIKKNQEIERLNRTVAQLVRRGLGWGVIWCEEVLGWMWGGPVGTRMCGCK